MVNNTYQTGNNWHDQPSMVPTQRIVCCRLLPTCTRQQSAKHHSATCWTSVAVPVRWRVSLCHQYVQRLTRQQTKGQQHVDYVSAMIFAAASTTINHTFNYSLCNVSVEKPQHIHLLNSWKKQCDDFFEGGDTPTMQQKQTLSKSVNVAIMACTWSCVPVSWMTCPNSLRHLLFKYRYL